ncbi:MULTISPECIES: hypothetical protein [Cellulophaga]|uniref:Beta-lactamase-inhibitor-like, PepSY-like n=1 Tax=Cellulophaga baltica TaxID=76594 RepID=A0A1G7H3V1_9FLAO|nr:MULTISPECIES: hypothetical protein [Cellulophaga]AIY12308.1 hypothetical protein M667_03235 [Cellulophaga baltica NN016038]KGK29266.1 hypothetical protein EL45_16355 [Cellulophaga sp. E6(2014)]SDE95128.1 hypothetical protein SAMN04487992_105260 [Cellulophaga baltica]
MKQLVFATALAIGSLGTITATETTPIFHDGIMEGIFAQDFSEIKIEALPEEITAALAKNFPGASISQAFVNEEAEYKLIVTSETGEEMELYADAEGNWLDM